MKQKRAVLLMLFIICAIGVNTVEAQVIDRLEPPFWWTGMQNDTLQIMVYGAEIGTTSPTVDHPSIALIKVERPENQNYLFLYLNIGQAGIGSFQIQFKSNDKKTISYKYNLKEKNKKNIDRKGFSTADVFYLLMPDRFSNGNTLNDTHPKMLEKINREYAGGRHGGDIQGIINHLDYLLDLGVTTLWSTPFLEDNVPVYSYHGYAISDFYHIDPRYGSNDDYKRLGLALHQRGMKLVMDAVTNHCSSVHWWMDDLPYEDWIHQFPKFQRSNYRMTTQFDPYKSEIDFKLCEKGWFDTTMPDLNQSNAHLIRYLAQNAIWWMEYAALDGFRVDTYSYNDKKGIAYWTKRIMTEYPNTNIMGEVWMHSQAEIAYWQTGNTLSGDYDTGLPTVMDFTLYDAFSKALNENNATWSDGMIKVYNNFTNDFLYPNPMNLLVFGENHDTDRIWHVLNGDFSKYKLALSLLLTTRGIPQLYYGSEIGMTGAKSNGDGDLRKDFPGGWDEDKHNAFLSAQRTIEESKIHDFTSKLLNWRKNKKVIHDGKMMHYVPQDNVYVYFRYMNNDLVMVILNNSTENQTIEIDRYQEMLQGRTAFYDVLKGQKINLNKLVVPSKSPVILESYK